MKISFMDATEDVMDSIAVVNITENTGRRKRKNTHNNCASKKTKKQATSSQLKMVEETMAKCYHSRIQPTHDLYSNFSSDEEVGDEGDLQVRFSNNTTNEPGLKSSLNTNLHDRVAVLRKENLYFKTVVERTFTSRP